MKVQTMKQKILIAIFAAIFCCPAWGQQVVNNFEIEDKEIVWRKIFEAELTFDQLVERIRDSGLLENMELAENKVTGNIKDVAADFKGAGFSEMGTPMYVARSHFGAFTIIEHKDGKYRVTLKRVILTQKYDDGLSEQGERTNLDVFALKTTKDQMKGAFKKSPSLILDYTFTDKFLFKDGPSKNDW